MLTPEEGAAAAVGEAGWAGAGWTATAAAAMSGAVWGESGAAAGGTVVAGGDGECGDGWLSIGPVEGGSFNLKGA